MRIFKIILGSGIVLLGLTMSASALTLPESIDIALAKNAQVVQAQEKVNSAYARIGQAVANFFPKLSLDASLGQNYTQPYSIVLPPSLGGGTFSTSPDQAANLTTYSLTVRENLFNGGKDIQGYSIADITYQAAKEDLRRAQNETELNLISSFYDVLKTKKSLDLVNDSMANLKRNLEQTQIFYNAGIASNVDLLRAKMQVANLAVSRIQAESGWALARMVFETNLGEKLEPGTELVEDVLSNDRTTPLSSEDVLKAAFDHRPEWKAYKMGLDVAEKAISLTYGNFLPTLSYIYSRGATKNEYPGSPLYNTDLASWRSLLVASWSIFDGFSTVNQIKDVQAQLKAAQAQEKIIQDGIALEVKSAYLNLLSARDRIAAAEVASDLAERTLKTAEINYKANILSEQNYLEVQTAHQASQLLLWTARYDFEVAKAKLNKAVGKKLI